MIFFIKNNNNDPVYTTLQQSIGDLCGREHPGKKSDAHADKNITQTIPKFQIDKKHLHAITSTLQFCYILVHTAIRNIWEAILKID